LLQRPEQPFGTMVNYPNHGELSYDWGVGVDRRKQDIERLRRLAGEIVSICSNFSSRNLSGQGCFRRYKSIQIMVKVVIIFFCDSAILDTKAPEVTKVVELQISRSISYTWRSSPESSTHGGVFLQGT